MTNKYLSIIIGGCLLLGAASCGERADDSATGAGEGDDNRVAATSNVAEVTVATLEPKMFSYDIVSNGKVSAAAYADLRFPATDAVISTIKVKNGQRVSRGETVAVLDRFSLDNDLANATATLDRARLELADALIGQGYDPDRMSDVPPEVMRLARLRSGVTQAETQLARAERALSEATLTAPFDGVVANLFQKAGNRPDGAEPLCRIISTAGMEIDFPVLESELPLVRPGDEVECSPYSNSRVYRGRVTEINPVVDKDGMVRIRALMASGEGLYDGMNVRVNVKREIERALVIPKSALVLRSLGRKVVFTHVDGRAIWNYVTTSLENMNEYVVTEGLEPGQEIITGGNINLSHEAPVKVVSD